MNRARPRGWGLYVIVLGLVSLASIPFAGSVVLRALLATLGLSLVYHGVALVRSGSYAG